MAFTFGFYNSLNHDRRYDSISISKIFDGLITDGIYATVGNKFKVTLSTNDNEVVVGSGRAWFDHTWNLNDSDMILTGLESHEIFDRWDAIILDINSDNEYRDNSIKWIYGTAAGSPTKPELINTTAHHQYPLAYIYRRANTVIAASDITNTIGTDACPYCAGLLTDTKNIAPVEENDTATRAYQKGEYILWQDELCKTTAAIVQNAQLILYPDTNYNLKKTTISEEFYKMMSMAGVISYEYDAQNDDLYLTLLTPDDL